MASFARVILMGNVTRPLELRYTPTGKPVVDVGMAMNKRVPDSNGGWKEKVVYMDVTFWAGAAETLAQYLAKGDLFFCEGELDQEERIIHKGKPEERREKKTRVTGTSFQFMPRRTADGERGGKSDPAPVRGRPLPEPERGSMPVRESQPGLEEEDEIPF